MIQTSDIRLQTSVGTLAVMLCWCGTVAAAETSTTQLRAAVKPRATAADVKAVASKAAAQHQAERPKLDEKVELKRVSGVVSGVGSGFIAVEFQRDEKKGASLEMALPVDPQTKFQSVESLRALQLGDTVMVEYQEATSKDSLGDYTQVKRTATAIGLLKRAPEPEVAGSSDPGGHPE